MADEFRWKYEIVMQYHSIFVFIKIESTYVCTEKKLEETTSRDCQWLSLGSGIMKNF